MPDRRYTVVPSSRIPHPWRRFGIRRPDGCMHPWTFDTRAEAQEACDFQNKDCK
jgi:hypothetical protein